MQLAEPNDELYNVKGAMEYYLKVMNRCKYRLKLVTLCTIVSTNWVTITRVNFGTGSGYPVPAKNH